MPGIEEVLERLVTDASFRHELTDDPQAALAGYELTEEDLELLATQLDSEAGGVGPVEQRTSKSALFALLAGGLETGIQDGTSNTVMLSESDPIGSGAGHDYGYMDDDIPSGAPPEDPDISAGEGDRTGGSSVRMAKNGDVTIQGKDITDVDRPVVTGSVHNPPDGPVPGNEIAMEELTIANESVEPDGYGQVKMEDVLVSSYGATDDGAEMDGVTIRQIQEVSGDEEAPEALADGGPTDPEEADADATGDVVVKGSKILQNAVPDGSDEGIEGSDIGTGGYVAAEPIGDDLPEDDD